jgi:hypothetical protein
VGGRAVAQAVIAGIPERRPGFDGSNYVESVVVRAVQYFAFPCHSFIPLSVPQSSPSIIQGWYNTPISEFSNSGLGSTPASYMNTKTVCCGVPTASVVQWSDFLAANPEVLCSIPGAARFSE